MCGIAALLDRTGRGIDREALGRMSDRMTSRGPDGSGIWITQAGEAGLAHRRLSILDLSDAGAQPMHSADGRLVITFNGEIYNFQALRDELEADGVAFASGTDTEVLLHLYARHGRAMVNRLRGMYAFGIWDAERRGLLLARDPYGIKPLYVSDDGQTVRVASQVKAILTAGNIDTSPEPAGHVGYHLWGSVPEPYTLYRGIRALPAGHTLWIDGDGPHDPVAFAAVSDVLRRAPSTSEPLDLRGVLLDTVRHHLVADVPVGVFLSAGLDSTTLAALATEVGGTLRTITLGFEQYRGAPGDEVPLAEEVARRYGADHQTVWITQNDFTGAREHLLHHMDQPTLDGINSYFVSQAAAQAGLKVALSGVGGDELFGGYSSFREIPRLMRMLGPAARVPGLGRSLRAVSAPVLRRLTSPKYAGLLEYGGSYGGAYLLRRGLFMPWELPRLLDPDLVAEGWQALEPVARLDAVAHNMPSMHAAVTALESTAYMRNQLLRDTDWASMAHSLEVRTPLVDWTLLRSTAPHLGLSGPTKQEAARTVRPSLPLSVLNRPKTGFTVPVRDWLLEGEAPAGRGLRGWARHVYQVQTGTTSPALTA